MEYASKSIGNKTSAPTSFEKHLKNIIKHKKLIKNAKQVLVHVKNILRLLKIIVVFC